MAKKVTMYLVTPDDEQGCYLYTKKEVVEFIAGHLDYALEDQAEVVFTIMKTQMSMKEIEELPEYEG